MEDGLTEVWFKVDDGLAFHAKTVSVGNTAMGMWVRAGSWSLQQLTDGFIPTHIMLTIGTKINANALVSAGLWDETEGGYLFHDWDEYQPTSAEIRSGRAAVHEAKAKAGRIGGVASGVARRKHARSRSEAKQEAKPKQNEAPTRPVLPTTTLLGETTVQTLLGEWIDHCSQRPPNKVIGQISRELKTLIEDGYSPESLRAGLADWHRKGIHPATLPSVVHALVNSPARSTTDKRVADGLSVVQRFAEIERKELA